MTDEPQEIGNSQSASRILARILSFVIIGTLLLTALGYAGIRWLDTESGRAFVVRQLPGFRPEIGLVVSAGRIDGSLFGKATIHDLTLSDPKGVFAVVPVLEVDWRPLDLFTKTLTVNDLFSPEVRVLRSPSLLPSTSKTFFPDFNFDIARLRIDRLILEPPVSGKRRVLGVAGNFTITSGRAKVDLTALTLAESGQSGSGDTVRLKLDVEPDANKFDLDADIVAPAGGAIANLLGLSKPLAIKLQGDGSWQVWDGRLDATLGGTAIADLVLTARSGAFAAKGSAMPAAVFNGAAARLLGPVLSIDTTAKVADQKAHVAVRLSSEAIAVDAHADLDFADESINDAVINARLLNPAAVSPQFRAGDARLVAKVAGTFAEPLVDYLVTATSLGTAKIAATNVRVAGIIRAGERPLVVPLTLTAARVTGFGATADPLLTNIRVDGPLTLANGRLTSTGLRFRSDRMNGTATAAVTFATGQYVLTVDGALPGFPVAGLGVADLGTNLRIAGEGSGARITGPVSARVTRLDNSGINAITQGLPTVVATINVAPDLSLTFTNARLTSPGITFTANGSRSANGILNITGSGVSRDYGPVSVAIAGPTATPTIDIKMAKPGVGIGLVNLTARIAPATAGWGFTAAAGSDYGPVTANGLVRTGSGPLAIDITKATIAGLTGRGTLQQTAAGPFAGKLDLVGPGINGVITASAQGNVQRIDANITAKDAKFDLAEPIALDSGTVRLSALLPPAGSLSATGSFDLVGIERSTLRIDRTQGSLTYANGQGTAKASASGTTNIPFKANLTASLSPNRIEVRADGTLDGRPIKMSGPAIITRGEPGPTIGSRKGWTLAPFTIITPDGTAEISGSFGQKNALRAKFDRVSLALVSIAYPSVDLTGRMSGTIDIAVPAGGVPAGTANLRINALSRAGVASVSLPIDIGLNAEVTASGAVARAVIVRGGKVEGRAQVRIGPIQPGNSPLKERILASPIFGQLRYNGPAQALWGLSGVEAIDVRGPLAIVADVGGKVGDPRLTGTMRSEGARVESTAIGAVFDQVSLDSRFANSRLEIIRFTGRAGTGGTITGTGGIDLSAERSFPMDIRVKFDNAKLADRDDFTGIATGNIRIATDEYGGVISGKLKIDRATYRIGRSNSITVPTLNVTEKNTKVLKRPVATYLPPTRWLLNVDITADRRLFVSGMGLEAEWRADIKVKGGATTPEVTGRVDLVRGDYDFAGKRFTLTRGSIRFAGGFPPDPQIDISATSSQGGFTAQIDITGTAVRPEIRFSSVPALPEDEVLSRVLFGESVSNLSAPEALQLAAALNSLRGSGGFNPVNSIRKGLGIDRLRILPADATRGRGTTVAAGQYIGRNVYVELATDAQGYTSTNIEISLTSSLSILSSIETLGGTSASLRWKRDY